MTCFVDTKNEWQSFSMQNKSSHTKKAKTINIASFSWFTTLPQLLNTKPLRPQNRHEISCWSSFVTFVILGALLDLFHLALISQKQRLRNQMKNQRGLHKRILGEIATFREFESNINNLEYFARADTKVIKVKRVAKRIHQNIYSTANKTNQ